jgi:hypothetical protein
VLNKQLQLREQCANRRNLSDSKEQTENKEARDSGRGRNKLKGDQVGVVCYIRVGRKRYFILNTQLADFISGGDKLQFGAAC